LFDIATEAGQDGSRETLSNERANPSLPWEANLVMTTALAAGLEIIAAVTLMTVVVCPMLVWILPDRSQPVG
jgi:hypothetical protein